METTVLDQKFGQLIVSGAITSTLPLQKTTFACQIAGLIATSQVTQYFSNPLMAPAELEYLFPLPHKAAMVDFEIKIGSKKIKADLQETGQAERTYEEANQAGQQAALVKQNRPNVFAIRLANVMPGEPIQAALTYEERLTVREGEVEFVFPMGLTPRYTSAAHSDEGQGVNPPVALPGEPVGPVEIQIHADLGSATGQPYSPSHKVLADQDGSAWQIQLASPEIPDHDFILRIPTSGTELHLSAWSSRDQTGETVLINWLPPAGSQAAPTVQPRDFIFVLDRSGSMMGDPIQQARNALKACLRILEPQDTFRILLFDDQLEWYRSNASIVSQAEIDQADAYLDQVEGRGGTEIIAAMEAALAVPCGKDQIRYILFLTDGAVSAEDRAIAAIRKQAGQARIFTFGIGPSVNRALLSSLARIGRGAAEFLQLDEDIEGAILRFQDKIAFPMLTQIQLSWTGCQAWDSYPEILPDLYSGEALELSTRVKRTSADPQVTMTGYRGGEKVSISLPLPLVEEDRTAIPRAWARARVDALLEQMQSGQSANHTLRQEIIQLAIEHRLMTPFTSFVAVNTEVVNAEGKSQQIQIAQPLPAGLDWSGFFPAPQQAYSMSMLRSMAMPAPAAQATQNLYVSESDGYLSKQAIPGAGLLKRLTKKTRHSPQERFTAETTDTAPMPMPEPDSQSVLRGLARSQKLDGSWNQDVELTAAALLAFLRHGHTLRAGNFRKQVQKARSWIEQAQIHSSLAGYARVLALFELAQADNDLPAKQKVLSDLRTLPTPANKFEQAVSYRLLSSEEKPEVPQACQSLEDLRLVSALGEPAKNKITLNTNDQLDPAMVWWATLK